MNPDLRIRPEIGEIWTELDEDRVVTGLVTIEGQSLLNHSIYADSFPEGDFRILRRHKLGQRIETEMEALAWISNLPERIIA